MSTMNIHRVRYGKAQFEDRSLTLVDFAPQILEANRHRSKQLTRQEVEWHWEEQVMKAYPDSEDEMRMFLLEQKTCPAFHQYWEKRQDEEVWAQKRQFYKDQCTFYQSDRNLSDAERKTNRWSVIMTSAATGDIIVPDIRVFPLCRVSYLDTARKILAANPDKKLEKHEMDDLWDGVMVTIYDFEVTPWDRKLHEMISVPDYRKLQEEAKISRKRKRGEHHDVSDNSDDEDLSATKVKTDVKAVKAVGPHQKSGKSASTTPIQASSMSIPTALGESRIDAHLATPVTMIPPLSSTSPAPRALARVPTTGSDQALQAEEQVHPVQERGRGRGRGRGIRRGQGNRPRQSAAPQRARVDPEATLIPTPTRRPNPPAAAAPTASTAPTTAARPRNPPISGTNWNPTRSQMDEMSENRLAEVGAARSNYECSKGLWRRYPKNQYER